MKFRSILGWILREHPGAIPQRQLWHSDEEGCEWVLGSFMPDQDSFLATFESHGFER